MIITVNVITALMVAIGAEVIPRGVIISQSPSLVMIINLGRSIKKEMGAGR